MASIVFADMDGTFLATDKSVPLANLQALDVLLQHHVPFVPCTGRPVSAVPKQIIVHEATRYAVGSNGAVVFDVAQNEALHVERMQADRILALYERVRHLNATFDVFADGAVYAERWRYNAMGSLGIDEPTLVVLRNVRTPVDLTVPQIVDRANSIEKITCFWKDEQDRKALQKAIDDIGGFSSAHGHPKNFELQAEGVSKGSALVWLCSHLGIPTCEAVAFGDEANDLPMLLAAGDGVAMANATSEIQDASDHRTTSNDEAGVARYLEHLFV